MYRTAYQRGMLTVFFSGGSKPLDIWDTQTKDGYIKRFLDQEIKTMVLEIRGANISTTYIICPKGDEVLGIHMPFLVMIVKNLNKYFSFEVTVLDETGTRRRFRVSNFQSTTQILPLCTVMPIGLSNGWNQIQFNLAEFTRRAYKKEFVEVQKLKINANIRLRRIYFTERLMSEDELPPAYKLYFPLPSKGKKGTVEKETEKDINPKVTSKTELVQPELPAKKSLESMPVPAKSAAQVKELEPVQEIAGEQQVTSEGGEQKVVEKTPSVEKVASQTKPPDEAPPTAEPVAEETTAGEPTAGEPASEEPAAVEPPAGEPATAEPPTGEPTENEPTVENTGDVNVIEEPAPET